MTNSPWEVNWPGIIGVKFSLSRNELRRRVFESVSGEKHVKIKLINIKNDKENQIDA